MNLTNKPIEEVIRSAVQAVEPQSEFSDALWRQIAQTPLHSETRGERLRAFFQRPAWAVAALPVAALIFALINPQAVTAAFDRLIGFFPEIGFVEDGESTLYLPEPVTVEKDGVRLIVDQAVSDPNALVIAYHFEGLPEVEAGEVMACVFTDTQVRTPNGKARPPIGGGISNNTGRVEFMPLTPGVDKVTLLVSAASPDPACSAPQEWEVELALGARPPLVTLAPVYEGEDIQAPAPVQETAAPAAESIQAAPAPEIRFAVDRVAELADGYIVAGHADWDDESIKDIFPDFTSVQVFDAGGQTVPVQPSEEGGSDSQFAFKVMGKEFRGPFTLHVKSALVFAIEESGPTFSFDAGANPQVGQSWEIGQTLKVFGYEVAIDSVRAILSDQAPAPDIASANGYAFAMRPAPEIQNLDLRLVTSQDLPQGFGGSGRNNQDGTYLLELVFPDGAPAGQVAFGVGNVNLALSGDWQASWQVPGQ